MKKDENCLRDIWEGIKCANIYITGIPEGEERQKGDYYVFENLIGVKFPNLGKEIDIQFQEAQSPKQHQPKEDHYKTYCN